MHNRIVRAPGALLLSTSTQRAVSDLLAAVRSPSTWWLLAWDDVKDRYRRTVLGPFWHVMMQAGTIVGLALIFSQVFNAERSDFLMYLTAGFLTWTMIVSFVNGGTQVFQHGAPLILAYDLPVSLHVFRNATNALIMFVHSLVIYAVMVVYTGVLPTAYILLALPAIALLYVIALGAGLVLGLLGARYRDVSPAVAAVMNFMFLVTPIFWERPRLDTAAALIEFNPLYHMIQIVREPLLGRLPSLENWLVCLGLAVVSLTLGVLAFMRYRRDLTYWI